MSCGTPNHNAGTGQETESRHVEVNLAIHSPCGQTIAIDEGIRSASEVYSRPAPPALLSETGATGPTGNRYGDAAGHPCMAIAGLEQSAITLETVSADRLANMHMFAATALNLMLQKPSH